MPHHDRRSFLQHSVLASATAMSLSGTRSLYAQDAKPTGGKSPNDRLHAAVVGVNGRGGSHISSIGNRSDVVISHICDIDEQVGAAKSAQIGKRQGTVPEFVRDIRKLLEDKSIDIVTIATPNHWHSLGALWAVQAGKDVYVEKPVSHNVSEGRRVVQAARKHGRIVQTGTQCRSNPGMREAMKFIHENGIGEVKIARGLCYKRRNSIGPKGQYPIPPQVDYNLWLGPAPEKPLTRPKFHYDWHWQWDYGNGDLGNQGIHQMDLCRWALNKNQISDRVFSYGGRFGYIDAGETANTQVIVHDYGSQQLVFEVRGLETPRMREVGVGIIVEGTKGSLVMSSYDEGQAFDLDGKVIKEFKGGGDEHHWANFIEAVRARDHKLLNADIEDGHLSSALCHLGNISLRLGKQIEGGQMLDALKDFNGHEDMRATYQRTAEHLEKNEVNVSKTLFSLGATLAINPKTETFKDAPAADAMLTRDYRKPFVVPSESEI